MCRFIAYLGNPILLDEVLFKPSNSLIKQSIRAKETDEPLNGDGFGLGWYTHEIDFTPGLFVSIQPAWNDRNLMHLAAKIRSNCFFAHVRAASQGGVSALNCHPFQYKNFLFMHNGEIGGFQKIKRFLRDKLNDEMYDWIQGQTDSEHLAALFLNNLARKKEYFTIEAIASTVRETIIETEKIKALHGIEDTSYINAAITNGKIMIAVRYISNPTEDAPSLHYSAGQYYECHANGVCHMHAGQVNNGAVLVSSEKLSNHKADWQDVPVNHILLVDEDLSTHLQPF